MADVVGTAYIRLRAISTQLSSDVKDAVSKARTDAKQASLGSGGGIGDDIATGIKKSLGGLGDDIAPDIDLAGKSVGKKFSLSIGDGVKEGLPAWTPKVSTALDDAFSKAGISAGRFFGPNLKKGILAGTNTMPDDLRKKLTPGLLRSFTNIGRSAASSFAKAFQTEGAKKKNNPFKGLLSFIDKIKIPGPAWLGIIGLPAIGGAAKILSSYFIGLVGLVGNLAHSLAGLGSAAVGAFGLASLAIVPLMLAFKTQTPQLERFQFLAKAVGKEWEKVGVSTQRTLLPGLTAALGMTKRFIPDFQKFGGVIGKIVGDFSKWTVAGLTTETQMFRIRTALAGSTGVVTNFLGAIREFVTSLPSLFSAVSPAANRFSSDVNGVLASFNANIQKAADSGALTAFFDRAYAKGRLLAGALTDFFIGLFNILKIGSETTQPIMDRFAEFAERFRTFTQSTEGQDRIRKIFENALPVMREVNELIKAIVEAIFAPVAEGDTSGVVHFLQVLRLEILPAIINMVSTISSNLDSGAMTELVSGFAKLFTKFAEGNSIANTLGVLNVALKLLLEIISNPVIGPAVTALLGLLGVLKGFALIAKYTGLGKIATGLLDLTGGMLGATKAAQGTGVIAASIGKIGSSSTALSSIGASLAGLFTTGGALTGLMTVLGGLATAAAPFAAIAAGIAAIGAIAYFVFPPFRDLIDGIWDKFNRLKDAIVNLFTGDGDIKSRLAEVGKAFLDFGASILTLPFTFPAKIIQGLVEGLVDKVPGIFSKLVELFGGWISEAPGMIGGFVSAIAEAIGGLPEKVGGLLGTAGSFLTDWIVTAGETVGPILVEFGDKIWEAVQKIPGIVGEALLDAGSALLDWIKEVVPQIPAKVGYFIGFLLGSLAKIAILVPITMLSAGPTLFSWIIDAIGPMLGAIGNFILSLVGKIVEFVAGIPGLFFSAVGALWGWISEAVPAMVTAWIDFNVTLLTMIGEFVIGLPGKFVDAVSAMWGWLSEAIPKALEALGQFERDIFSKVLEFVTSLPGKFVDAIGAMTGWLDTAKSELPGKLIEFGSKIFEWAQELPGKIITAIGDIAGDMLDIGKSIVEGIWKGIESLQGWIGDKVKEFAGGLVSGIGDAIGWGSPAKAFIPMGAAIPEGLVVGINQGKAQLNAALNSLVTPSSVSGLNFDVNAGVTGAATLRAMTAFAGTFDPTVVMTVKIGDQDITDIVDVQVSNRNDKMARALTARGLQGGI